MYMTCFRLNQVHVWNTIKSVCDLPSIFFYLVLCVRMCCCSFMLVSSYAFRISSIWFSHIECLRLPKEYDNRTDAFDKMPIKVGNGLICVVRASEKFLFFCALSLLEDFQLCVHFDVMIHYTAIHINHKH